MGLFDFLSSTKKAPSVVSASERDNLFNQIFFSIPSNGIPIPNSYSLQEFADFYDTNALIYALIDWKASRAAEIQPVLYLIKDTKSAKEFKKWNGKYINEYELKQLAKVKAVAYEEIDLNAVTTSDLTYGKLKQIFKQPSPLYSWKQFVYMYMASRDVSGFSAIWGNRLDSGLNKGKIQSLYPLPSHITQIIGGTQFEPIHGYKVIEASYQKEFLAEDTMLLRNHSFKYGVQGEFLYGTPRVKAAVREIKTYNASKLREEFGFVTGDARTLLSPKDRDYAEHLNSLSPESKQKWFDDMFKRLRQTNRENVAVTNVPMDATRIDSPLSESRTTEAQKSILETLCGVWHISPILMGSQASSTFNNMKEVGKISLRDAVFPEMRELGEGLNDFLIKGYGENLELALDFDNFEEFSEDIKVQAEALDKMPFLTDNEKRDWVDYAPLPDDKANLPAAYWDTPIVSNDGSYL